MTDPAPAAPSSILHRFSPEALFAVSGISQYVGAVIAISLFDDLGAGTVAWLRVLGAAMVILAVTWRQQRGWTLSQLRSALLFGTAMALMNVTFYFAIERIDLGKSVVIEFIGPIAVAAAFTRTRRNTLALLLAVGGVLVLSGVEIDDEPVGLFFILLASALWAAYIMLGRRVAGFDRGAAGLAVAMSFAVVVLLPFGWGGIGTALDHPGWLLAALSVGVLSNVVGYGIDQHVLRRVTVRRFAVLLALLPVSAMVVGFVALGQTPSPFDLVGAALVIAGVVVQEREELPAREPVSA